MVAMVGPTAFEDYVGEVGEECMVGFGLYRVERREVFVGVSGGADGERVGGDIEADKGGQEAHLTL